MAETIKTPWGEVPESVVESLRNYLGRQVVIKQCHSKSEWVGKVGTVTCTQIPFASAPAEIKHMTYGLVVVWEEGTGWTVGLFRPDEVSLIGAGPEIPEAFKQGG